MAPHTPHRTEFLVSSRWPGMYCQKRNCPVRVAKWFFVVLWPQSRKNGRGAMRDDFTDTHCHFDFPPFSGHEVESLALAERVGVRKIIVPAVTAGRFVRVLKLAHNYPPLFAALGLHPLYIAQHHEPHLEQLAAFLAS
ncbi:MAG: TatD family hydrolase, partial [Serratia symbiotica]|nr:TatD family hydrolase [Serratia symbiotica]